MDAIVVAGRVNRALGGPFVAPWDLAELPDDFLEAALAFTTRLPGLIRARHEMDSHMDEWRQRAEGKVH